MALAVLVILVSLVGVGSLASPFPADGKVRELKSRGDLTSVLTAEGGPHLVYIFDSLDVHSHKKAPVVSAAAEALDGFVQVIALDARQPAFQWALNAWGVQVIPSVGLLHSSGANVNAQAASKLVASHLTPFTSGARRMEVFPHTKPITVDSLKKAALAALPDTSIERVSSAKSLDKVLSSIWTGGSNGLPREVAAAVLFTDKPKSSSLFKALSARFGGVVRFVEVVVKGGSSPVSHHNLFANTDTETLPALFVITKGNESVSVNRYPNEGELSPNAIGSFIEASAGLSPQLKADHTKRVNSLVASAHQRRSLAAAGCLVIRSAADWSETVVQHSGFKKASGPIRVIFSPNVVELQRRLLTTASSKAVTAPKLTFLVDSKQQTGLVSFFGSGRDSESHVVVDIIPSFQPDEVVYKFGVHPASLSSEMFLEKPALKKNLQVFDWSEAPSFAE